MPDDGPGLFTIGHSNQALDHFLGLLEQHCIEALADVWDQGTVRAAEKG